MEQILSLNTGASAVSFLDIKKESELAHVQLTEKNQKIIDTGQKL